MRAWQVTRLGEPVDVMELAEVAPPTPGPGQLLVRVRAVALNFPDVLMCRGQYQVRPPLPFTPGVELCGEVVDTGERVIGTPAANSGALGDYALMDAVDVLPAPESLDDDRAAAFLIGYQTAWFALHRRAGLRAGETLLVHAAAGGVGSAAVQLGKAAGATVIGVVGGPDKAKVARDLGADLVVDRRSEDFVAVVKEATGGRGADVVYDPVGGEAFERSTKCVAFEGRIVVVGFASGAIPTPPMSHVLIKNYSVLGLHWGLYRQRDPAAIRDAHRELTALADAGVAVPLVGERIAFEQAAEGIARLAAGDTVGRVVVTL
ncbi:NADPH:quinone oxidoreductase family protein [Longispora sp. K20-0274]|uniref:NADPH:quinone oxidoreductase family protein n=1 Tax=Longispora sp. K20-0274 TaxID=3088255 RepID=UPI00399A7296